VNVNDDCEKKAEERRKKRDAGGKPDDVSPWLNPALAKQEVEAYGGVMDCDQRSDAKQFMFFKKYCLAAKQVGESKIVTPAPLDAAADGTCAKIQEKGTNSLGGIDEAALLGIKAAFEKAFPGKVMKGGAKKAATATSKFRARPASRRHF